MNIPKPEMKKNYRKTYAKRKIKTQPGEMKFSVPHVCNREYESKITEKYQNNADGL